MQSLEDVNQVLVSRFAVVHHQMTEENEHHHHDDELLLASKLNVLKLSVCIIGDENKRILKILNDQIIELAELIYRSYLHELFFHDPLEIEKQIINDRRLLPLVVGKCIQKGLRFKKR